MDRYVAYLRTPGSHPLTIQQFNRQHQTLLDLDTEFEHACLVAWREGSLLRRGNRGATLTNAFPTPPALRTAAPLRLGAREIRFEPHGRPARAVRLSSAEESALRAFAQRTQDSALSPVPAAIAHLVTPCARRAAASLVDQLDHGMPTPTLRRPTAAL